MQPFFLQAPGRSLFCVYHPPSDGVGSRGSVLHVPAFAEEMHKSRRMVALQARRLARHGLGVLILDPTGCGDSSGDFADARWPLWLEDLRIGLAWLRAHATGPSLLWGLRLGALLAMEVAQDAGDVVTGLLLWQPVTNGAQYLTELLRIKMAGEVVEGRKTSVQALRDILGKGQPVEMGGYEMNPGLTTGFDGRSISDSVLPGLAAGWFEVTPEPADTLPPASRRAIDALGRGGVQVHAELVAGEPFWDWNAADITECPELLVRTERVVEVILNTR